jgi:hypothetical protein
MRQMALLATLSLLILCLVSPVFAAETAKQDIVGDWKMKSTNTDGPPMDAIMMLSKDKDGKLAGKWLSFFGPSDLKDVKYEGDKLMFVQTFRFGGQEMSSDFTGTLKDGKITGTFVSDQGEMNMEGTPMPAKNTVAGIWEITTKRQDRETTSTLIIKADKDGKLSGTWKSQRGDSEIPEITFKDEKLTFKRKITRQDQPEMEISYELAVKGNTISGVTKTERGESTVTGKRADSPAVGTWELTIASDRGDRSQLLTVYPDMTALYGPSDLDTFAVEDNKMSFKMKRTFGDRSFEMDFKGTVEGDKITGEMTSTGGPNGPTTQKVTGKKVGAEVKVEVKTETKVEVKTEPKKEAPAAK